MRLPALAIAVLVAACGSEPKPEPVVQIQQVGMPVTTSCVPDNLGVRPAFPDSLEAIQATTEPAELEKLLYAGIKVRDRWIADLETVVTNCRKPRPPQ